MPTPAGQPTLLSAARDFMRKSAGKAALVIAPLAAVALAPDAQSQTAIFGGAQTSGSFFTSVSGSGALINISPSGFFSLPPSGGGSERFGQALTTITHSSGGSAYLAGNVTTYFNSLSFQTSGSLPVGTSVPFDYNFTLTPSGVSNVTWKVEVDLNDQNEAGYVQQFTGSGTGNISSSTFLTINSSDNPNGLPTFNNYQVILTVYFESSTYGDSLSIAMDKNAGQGFAFSAPIPEPSAYAAFFGLGALGFVVLRRSRRCAA